MDPIRRFAVVLLALLMVGLLIGCIHEGIGTKLISVRHETDRPVVVRRDGDVTWGIGVGAFWEIERPRTADFTQDYEILDAETCVLKEMVTVDTAVTWDAMILLPPTGPARVELINKMPLRDRPEQTSRIPGLCTGIETPRPSN